MAAQKSKKLWVIKFNQFWGFWSIGGHFWEENSMERKRKRK